jgi:A/G-specific adenine glycosylase
MAWPASSALLAPLAPWFERSRRSLPWRAEDLSASHPDPYAVLVSELMLQQTQVATVVPYFDRWMRRFPDPATLAAATEDEIHGLWQGLGYYRRARLLQAAARTVAEEGWPRDLKGLLALPGLGPYTAAAIASIAFQVPEPALDGNAFRVLARLLGIEDDPRKSAARLRAWLIDTLEVHGPSRMTQAIMELGATVCGPTPRCPECPLHSRCEAHRQNATDRIPARKSRPAPRSVAIWLMAIQSEGHWLLHPPAPRGLLAGLWRWPALTLESDHDMAAEVALPFGLAGLRTWAAWTQVYSHRRERVSPIALEIEVPFPAPQGMTWVETGTIGSLPMGRRDQRLRDLLQTPSIRSEEAPPTAGLLDALRSIP